MSADDRDLRDAWRERAPRSPEGCPDAEAILRAATGRARPAEVRAVAEHAMRCAGCAEDWRLARALAPATTAAQERPAAPRRAWHAPLLAAAALVIGVAGIGLVALRVPVQPDAAWRDATSTAIRSKLAESSALPRDRFLLVWTPGPPGTVYDIEVGTPSLQVLSRARALTSTVYLVPAERLTSIPAGGVVAWRVEATLPDGRRVASVTHLNQVR